MKLTEEQIEHFYREGYVVVSELVSAEAIRKVLAAAPKPREGAETWQATALNFETPDAEAPIHRLLVEPDVIEAVETIFGASARAYYGMLAIVPARGGNGLPWHQDNQYSHIHGGALNTFIALSEITPEKANLWVAPRSHRSGTQPSRANTTTAPGHREALIEPENALLLPALQPGDACIFDRNTLHRSLQNETDEDRYAYAAQYTSRNARYSETGLIPPHRMLVSELRERWLNAGLLE